MRHVLVAMILAAVTVVPAAAQDRVGDRVVVNALVGPGFVGDAAVVNTRAAAGVKATDWMNVVGEWGTLSNMDRENVLSGQHINANAVFTTPRPVYYNLRPYATAGIGAFRAGSGFTSANDRSDFATNVGAGVAYDFNRWLGVNLDYRRFFVDYGRTVDGKDRWTLGLNIGLR